jgi:hypothetical protein
VKCSKYEELIDGKCQPVACLPVEGPGGCNCIFDNKCEIPEPEPIPICDENTPPNEPCRDEGDPDDCEPGFVDRGDGCELIEEEEEPEPVIEEPTEKELPEEMEGQVEEDISVRMRLPRIRERK